MAMTCAFSLGHGHGRVAIAKFSAQGISGQIKFTEEGENVRIEANLEGLRGVTKIMSVFNIPLSFPSTP